MSSGPRQTMPSMSDTFRPDSAIALRIASTRRSRLEVPGTRPSRLLPAPTMAQASRNSRDGSIIKISLERSVLNARLGADKSSLRELAQPRHDVGRRSVDAVEQRVDLRATDGIDLHALGLSVLEQSRVFHCRVESVAQHLDAIGRH